MKEYKPIILSLIKFFAVYIVLIAIYYLYLNYYQDILKTCDPFTEVVAKQSSLLLNLVGFPSETHHFNQENYMHFSINNKYISGVNEGCNAISVIILFLSFVIAFLPGKIKTLLYILVTLPIIHFANIIRIAFINYVFYYYPQYGKDVHDYIFPAIIYGLIIILWIIWIKYFVFVKMKNKIRILGIIFCFILLITIRRLEVVLFYDPLLAFYKQTKFNHLPVPDFNIIKLILSLIFRYTLNTFLSLLILKLWFNNKSILKLSLYIYIIGFIIFTILYIGSLYTNFGLGYMPTFYIRRILIQPVILLILIPSVYYYKYTKNKSTN